MMRWHAVVLMVVAVGTLTPGPTPAQVLPFERNDGNRARAELHAAVLGEFQQLMGKWVAAVNSRDADRLADLYDADAFLFLGDTAVRSDQIQGALESWLADLQSVSFGLSSFDASTSLSYGSGRVVITDSGRGAQGTMILVLRRHGRDDWRIRSQTLLLDEPTAATSSSGPGSTPAAHSPGMPPPPM